MYRVVCLLAAVFMVALLPVYEKGLNNIIEGFRVRYAALSGAKPSQSAIGDEEDILNNRNKWRMIIIGYCIFILFMVFATVSIATLNTKINNISAATGDILDRLSVLESND